MLTSSEQTVDWIAATRFAEALSDTPAELWLEASRTARVTWGERARALEVLAALTRELRLDLMLWNLTDAIETSAWYAFSRSCDASETKRQAEARSCAIEAAKIASFALLLRRYLTAAQFNALFRPFQVLQPERSPSLVP